jgi:hypothetical protein
MDSLPASRHWTSPAFGVISIAVPALRNAGPFPGAIADFTWGTLSSSSFPDAVGDFLQKCRGLGESEEFMFETPEEVKPKASMGLWLGIVAVVAVLAAGGYFFLKSKGSANQHLSAASAPAAVKGNADPVHDLKIQRATMNKDRNGTMAVWLVTIENKSPVYSYSKIEYETTYVGADNNAILINKGTIPAAISPGEQNNAEINDALYPAGTAWYKIRITGATPAAQ